ncbi:hypothetical protein J6R97_00940 [bacterium]|nr:hypothetical protein [bacterium]
MLKVNNIQGLNGRFVKQRLSNDSNTENRTNLSFTSNVVESNENAIKEKDKEKKSKLSFKKITNVLGTLAGVGIISYAGFSMGLRPKWMKNLTNKNKKLETKLKAQIEKLKVKEGLKAGTEEKGNAWYNIGAKVQGAVEQIGEELSNNLLYGIGTCIIMPLVLLYSPFGKKDSTKEDKFFAVARQPLSFITMFSMQLTFDKLFSRWSKSIIDQNVLETKNVQDALSKGGDIDEKILEQIKYNDKPLKSSFKNEYTKFIEVLTGNAKDADKDITMLDKIKSPSEQINEFKAILTKLENDPEYKVKFNKDTATKLEKSFERYVNVKNNSKLRTESIKIVSNVLVSQIIGCTLLNVIYGKAMKGWAKYKEQKKLNELQNNNINNQAIENINSENKNEGKVA